MLQAILVVSCLSDHIVVIFFILLNHIDWLRITDEGSVLEMCKLSILLIKSNSKWCIHLHRSRFLNFNFLVSVTAGGPESPRGHMNQSFHVVNSLNLPVWIQLVSAILGHHFSIYKAILFG